MLNKRQSWKFYICMGATALLQIGTAHPSQAAPLVNPYEFQTKKETVPAPAGTRFDGYATCGKKYKWPTFMCNDFANSFKDEVGAEFTTYKYCFGPYSNALFIVATPSTWKYNCVRHCMNIVQIDNTSKDKDKIKFCL